MINIAQKVTAVAFLKSLVVRRLIAGDVVFTRLSFVNDHRVAFRMKSVPNAGQLFGLAFVPDGQITVTAFYDMVHRRPCCTLELLVFTEDREYRSEYMLTKEERRMLCDKMEDFFRQRVGTEMEQFCMKQLAETDALRRAVI